MNRTFRNSIIFMWVFFTLLLADLLLKHYFFDIHNQYNPGDSSTWKDFKVIGIRSLKHDSTTFLDFINVSIPNAANVAISLSLGFIFLIVLTVVKSKWMAVGLSIMLAGLMGNTLDNIFLGYVRDILYTPWLEKGTFNLADTLIIAGIPFIIIPSFFTLAKEK